MQLERKCHSDKWHEKCQFIKDDRENIFKNASSTHELLSDRWIIFEFEGAACTEWNENGVLDREVPLRIVE